MPVPAPNHADGTRCLEGTKRVPRSFRPCCEVFAGHVATCAHDLRYEWWPKARQWVIAIAESAGGGGISIEFCPHCGARLRRGRAPARRSSKGMRVLRIPPAPSGPARGRRS